MARINFSDFSRTRTLGDQPLDSRDQTYPGTHIDRLTGLIGTPEQIAAFQNLWNESESIVLQRFLIQQLNDVVDSLDALGITITLGGDSSTPSDYDAGPEMNALSDFVSARRLDTPGSREDKNSSVYPTTADNDEDTVDPSYN